MERKTIGAFLAVLRKANGMTQQQVADRLNVSNKTVSKWERDESLPDITLIPALAEMFHVTADEILRGQRMEKTEQTEAAQERRAEKVHSQARAMIARTMNKHLNWTTGAAAMLAAGMISLFTVSYAFYKPVLGFGIFTVLLLAGLVMEFLATNTARTALTGGEMIDEDDALAAEKRLLGRIRSLIGAAAVMLIWALPLILVRNDVYTDSVISWETYLYLIPVMAAMSVFAVLLTDWICVRIWPELREGYERTAGKLRRLYIAAGCALALILMAASAAMIIAGSTMTVEAQQTIEVQLDDEAAYREFEEMAEDCAQGGEAWIDYCLKNLTERGLPWKGSITDVDRDYLNEFGYLMEPDKSAGLTIEEMYGWAFYPDMVNVENGKISFEMVCYYVGDSGTQFGILLFVLIAAVVFAALVLLRRKYILQAEKRRLYEQAPADAVHEEPEEEQEEDE